MDHPAAVGARKDNDVALAEATVPQAHGEAIAQRAVTINRPREEVFAWFRDFRNLPQFMENVVSIEVLDNARSHWTVKAPGDQTVEWTSRVTEEERGRLIAWSTEDDADVASSGKVEFFDAGPRGTIVSALIQYEPPLGTVGKVVAKLFQREPAIQARRDLRRLKQLLETGEIATAAMNVNHLTEDE